MATRLRSSSFSMVLATCEGAGVAGEDSRFVRESINEAAAYLRRYSPNAAVRFQRRIRARAESLSRNPELGRIVPEHGVRQVRELIDGTGSGTACTATISRFWPCCTVLAMCDRARAVVQRASNGEIHVRRLAGGGGCPANYACRVRGAADPVVAAPPNRQSPIANRQSHP